MTAPVKILVTGGNGQLASELKELAGNYTNVSFVFFDRSELSISDHNELEKIFKIHQPQYFINCAAYTAVDKAEEEKKNDRSPPHDLPWSRSRAMLSFNFYGRRPKHMKRRGANSKRCCSLIAAHGSTAFT